MKSDSLLIIFTRTPEKGKVKTRLSPHLSEAASLSLHQAMIQDTLWLTDSLSLPRALACYPTPSHPFFKQCGKDRRLLVLQQEGGDLGARMKAAFEWGFSSGYVRVVIIGTDTPHLPIGFIEEAFASLHGETVVLGPSLDGGYYLIGVTRQMPGLFVNIPWGTDQVLMATLKKSGKAPVHLLPFWYDIDRFGDVALLREHLRILNRQGTPCAIETGKVLNLWKR